jgi:putative transposase
MGGKKIMSRYRRSLLVSGTFFFTVALADRRSALLVEQVERLRASYRRVQGDYPFETVAICVLPDHLHALWRLPVDDANFSLCWSLIKAGFSRGLAASVNLSESKIAKREKGIWQRRFWEHQIRDDLDLQRHVDYIHFNPVKHGHVARLVDWPYSSFHRYVADGIFRDDWAAGEAG